MPSTINGSSSHIQNIACAVEPNEPVYENHAVSRIVSHDMLEMAKSHTSGAVLNRDSGGRI